MNTTALTRAAFMHLSKQPSLKSLASRLRPFSKVASRFVAGESFEEAAAVVAGLNAAGCAASFDHLEEEVTTAKGAAEEVDAYLRMLKAISAQGMDANVSIKLSQLGLRFNRSLCYDNVRTVVEAAKASNNFVRIDMEGSDLTQPTLDLVRELRESFSDTDVGCVLQSCLRRTEEDAKTLLRLPVRIRLCKGAYLEPPSIAFPDKRDVDATYLRVMRQLMDSGGYHAIATHDERIVEETQAYAEKIRRPRRSFEFQLLYGIRRDLQKRLAAEGYRVRVYVPFGRSWYPYFMRRLAERPANVWFVAKNLMRG
jgi:proline dehydrogenase